MKDLKDQLKDKETGAMVEQAIKDGVITLDGEVSTEKQSNLASNTAKAVGVVDKVKNHIEVTNNK